MNLGNIKIEVVLGDITQQADITAIVNATNSELQIGDGLSGAIHTAAGTGLAEECESLAPIRIGEAVITGGHQLPNKYIIHVLGPFYGFNHPESSFLSRCYEDALKLAEEYEVDSIAFPGISTGEFGYPFEEATEIALSVIKTFSTKVKSIKLVRFVLRSEKDYTQYMDQLPRIV